MDLRNIKNWKENPKYQEIKLRMQDVKVKKTFRWIFEIAVTLAFAALTAVLMFQTVTMQESAMEPTIEVGDSFFMNRVIYKFSSPKRGDIIVFRTDASDDAALHIRRGIGLPGETILIRNGKIYIDGEEYMESGNYPAVTNPGLAENGVTLNSGEYFVLGDNRNNSQDSRSANVGVIHRDELLGRAWIRIWPLDKFGVIKHE